MADVVTSQTIVDTTGTKTVMKFTNICDGSGESPAIANDAGSTWQASKHYIPGP